MPFSTFANILNFVGLTLVIINLVQGLPDTEVRPSVAEIRTMPLFFGQAIFSFEGIGLVSMQLSFTKQLPSNKSITK